MRLFACSFVFLIAVLFPVYSNLVGGLQEQPLSILYEDVGTGQTLGYYLNQGVVQYNMMLNSIYFYSIVDGKDNLNIKSQVVQGVRYVITVSLAPSDCEKEIMLEVINI